MPRPLTDEYGEIVGRTWTAADHPAIVVEECLKWMYNHNGGSFVSAYLRRLADKYEKIEDSKKKVDG